jgi:hypothetical protein
MWKTLVDFFKGTSIPRQIFIHVFIVAGFLTPIWILAHITQGRASKFITEWKADLQPITCAGNGKLDLPISIQMPDEEKARLVGQFQEARGGMNFHFDVLATFYRNYFSTTILTGVLASIAAIALLFITSDGWQHSSPYARTIFLVATVSATYCAAFPSIFQQQQNIEDNKKLYLDYVDLTNEMCSYVSTEETADGTEEDAKAFIHYVDGRLKDLDKIAVGFDITKSPDFYEAIRKGVENGGTPAGKGTGTNRPKKPK